MKYTETFDLTAEEIQAAERIAKSLYKNCVGRENAVHRDVLIEKLAAAKKPIVTDKVRLFEMVQFIRVKNLCDPIIETNQKYYVAKDAKEVSDYVLYLESRINDIQRIKSALETKKAP